MNATIILTETIVIDGTTTTRTIEATGSVDQVRNLLAGAEGLLPSLDARPQSARLPVAVTCPLDVFQTRAGGSVRELAAAARENVIYWRNNPPAPFPMCTPSRKGLLSSLSDILNARF